MKALFAKLIGLFRKPPERPANLKLLYQYPADGLDINTIRDLTYLTDSQAAILMDSHKDHPWLRLVIRKVGEQHPVAYLDPRILCMILPDLDRPAIGMLWAYTLSRMIERRQNFEGLYLAEFMHEFYMGLPAQSSYEQAWYDQKANGVNLLDTKEQWT